MKHTYIYINTHTHTHTHTHIRGGTVHAFVPNRHGMDNSVRCMRPYDEYRQFTPNPEGGAAAMQRCLITASRRTANANGDTEAGAHVWLTVFYFDIVPTGCQVSNAGTDVFCVWVLCVCVRVRALWHDHFNCFLIPAESTLNTYCLINNQKSAIICVHSQWKQNRFYIYNM